MPLRFALVHSPLVGPVTWETLATALDDRGYQVTVPDLTATLSAGPPFVPRQAAVVADSVGKRPTILVAHSGAGPLLGAVGDACGGVAQGYVFMDAGLPTPGHSWVETAPPALADQLRGMARDGWLPPWPEWWGPDALAELLPDVEIRERFARGCPPLPMAMFEEALPPSPGWSDRPSAYLRLSDAYQEPAALAQALGWPVAELTRHHLSVVTEPELVAEALLDLRARLRR